MIDIRNIDQASYKQLDKIYQAAVNQMKLYVKVSEKIRTKLD